MSKKHLGVQLSHDGSTSRCWKLQMMFSYLLPSLYRHVVQAPGAEFCILPTDFLGATVSCLQDYRGTSKLELFSMSMTLSSIEPPTNLLMLHFVINLVINEYVEQYEGQYWSQGTMLIHSYQMDDWIFWALLILCRIFKPLNSLFF